MADRYEALERFAKLRDEGVLSEEEFAAEKAKLLDGGEAEPDLTTMRPARPAGPGRRPRWPIWLGVAALALVAVAVGLLLSTRATAPAAQSPGSAAAAATPKCDSDEAQDLVIKAAAARGTEVNAVTGAKQSGYDPATRVRTCTADLTLTGTDVTGGRFRLLPGAKGAYRAELLADAPVASARNTATTQDSTASQEADEPDEAASDAAYYRQQAALAAPKPITVFDEQGQLLCCVTMGDVVRFFSTQGASATIDPSDDGSAVIHVKDPVGRWRGLTGFDLNFAPAGPEKLGVRLVSLSVNDQPLAGADPNMLLRSSFDLRPQGGQ